MNHDQETDKYDLPVYRGVSSEGTAVVALPNIIEGSSIVVVYAEQDREGRFRLHRLKDNEETVQDYSDIKSLWTALVAAHRRNDEDIGDIEALWVRFHHPRPPDFPDRLKYFENAKQEIITSAQELFPSQDRRNEPSVPVFRQKSAPDGLDKAN